MRGAGHGVSTPAGGGPRVPPPCVLLLMHYRHTSAAPGIKHLRDPFDIICVTRSADPREIKHL